MVKREEIIVTTAAVAVEEEAQAEEEEGIEFRNCRICQYIALTLSGQMHHKRNTTLQLREVVPQRSRRHPNRRPREAIALTTSQHPLPKTFQYKHSGFGSLTTAGLLIQRKSTKKLV